MKQSTPALGLTTVLVLLVWYSTALAQVTMESGTRFGHDEDALKNAWAGESGTKDRTSTLFTSILRVRSGAGCVTISNRNAAID